MTPIAYPRIPLKQMDAAMLVFELAREIERVVADPEERAQVTAAAMVATHLHRYQTRRVRGDLPRVPYIEHPIRNTLRLIRHGKNDYALLIMSLLHDVLEDCAEEIVTEIAPVELVGDDIDQDNAALVRRAALVWLDEAFGPVVATGVEMVSNPVPGVSWDYTVHVATLAAWATGVVSDPIAVMALLVKASDLLDNAGSLRHQLAAGEDPRRIVRLAKKYLPVTQPVIEALTTLGEQDLADALTEVAGHLAVILAEH